MAVTRYGRTLIAEGPGISGAFYICDAFVDLPASGLYAGDKAVVVATQKRYTCYNGTSWAEDAGGGSTPSGTGWVHVTAGVQDGAATTPTAAETGALATSVFSGLAKISVGTGTPSTPGTGDLWIDTN